MPDIKALSLMHISEIKKAAEELSRLKGWSLGSAKGALKCVPMIVHEVEMIGTARELTGAEKQGLAVEIILKIVPLPWWLSERYARPLLETIVDIVVEGYNRSFKK